MDTYDKAQSLLNNASLVAPPAVAHGSGVKEFADCTSDMYPGFVNAPTQEIINAIEGAGLTRDGTDLTQLFQAIEALIAARLVGGIVQYAKVQGTLVNLGLGVNKNGNATLVLPANRKWTWVRIFAKVGMSSSDNWEFVRVENNTVNVNASAVFDVTIGDTYGTGNSDDAAYPTINYEFAPSDPLATNLVLGLFLDTVVGFTNNGSAMYAVGHHEAV